MRHFDLSNSTSLHVLLPTGGHQEPDLVRLEELLEYSARLLPAEGPIAEFVFQNPLHALEYLPFEEGARVGARLFGCEPYLSEERYREALARKRIRTVDLRSVLEEQAGAWGAVGELGSRLDLWMAMLQTPLVCGSAAELTWHLTETGALDRFPASAAAGARDQIVADAKRWVMRDLINTGPGGGYARPGPDDPRRRHVLWAPLATLDPLLHGDDRHRTREYEERLWEAFALRALWRVCCEGVRAAGPAPAPDRPAGERLRTALLSATGVDSDDLVHDLLIRFCAAFTDQGLANWALPDRGLGFFKSFCALYARPAALPEPWARGLGRELLRVRAAGLGPLDSIRESLDLMGVPEGEWEAVLPRTVLALRGWMSMIRQMEVRSDRVPQPVPRGTLTEVVAVRLILERLALAHVAREELGFTGPLADLRAVLLKGGGPGAPAAAEERAFPVFQIAQTCGWRPSVLNAFGPDRWADLLREIEAFPALERRRVFHLAYERLLRVRALDAVAARAARPARRPAAPRFQIATCIDAREESFRRHLEEVCPDVETFGAPGFYHVPIYYRGAGDAHYAAQCPVVIRPQHWVVEEPAYSLAEAHRSRARVRRLIGSLLHRIHIGSRSAAAGAVVTGLLGGLAAVPFVLRVLFPRLAARITRTAAGLVTPPAITRLVLERTDPASGPGEGGIGFNLEEMTAIAERVLRDIGLTRTFARLVIFFGHGSQSLNNPHLAAYHCGACSGNPGGANARALAAVLNDPRVRAALAARGLAVPADTVFVGASHNTGDETVTCYDLDALPRSHHRDFQFARSAIGAALERNAHEKARQFDTVPLTSPPSEAHRRVHARTEDLAQARAEFGNASNALCVVGRRERTRGLFFGRRSFLQSYNPLDDTPDGAVLARVLGAVIPVCQGINLEYYFSTVDPNGLGAGTKLPHNVVGMLGVMNGPSSDLRQGLPSQGTEIHEPVRLLFVIESYPEVVLGIMKANPVIDRIIRNGWSQLALLDPVSNEVRVFQNGAFHRYDPCATTLPEAASSAEWYSGSRDHLGFADVGPRTGWSPTCGGTN